MISRVVTNWSQDQPLRDMYRNVPIRGIAAIRVSSSYSWRELVNGQINRAVGSTVYVSDMAMVDQLSVRDVLIVSKHGGNQPCSCHGSPCVVRGCLACDPAG